MISSNKMMLNNDLIEVEVEGQLIEVFSWSCGRNEFGIPIRKLNFEFSGGADDITHLISVLSKALVQSTFNYNRTNEYEQAKK